MKESVKNPSFPLIIKGNDYFFLFSDNEEEKIEFCFFCGGYELGPSESTSDLCNCEILKKWSERVDSPIKTSTAFNEYYLLAGDGSTNIFYFCPSCGGKLRSSMRVKPATKLSETEITRFKKRFAGVKSIEEIISTIGEPDEKIIGNPEKIVPEENDFKQTLFYKSIFDGTTVIIAESKDGEVHYFFVDNC